MFDPSQRSDDFVQFYQQHLVNNTRGLVVVSGSLLHCEKVALECLTLLQKSLMPQPSLPAKWIANALPKGANTDLTDSLCCHVSPNTVSTLLGSSVSCIVINTYDGLNLNTLAMISGALAGGGLLVMLTPPFANWSTYSDPDYLRFSSRRPNTNSKCTPSIKGGFISRFEKMLESCRSDTSVNFYENKKAVVFFADQPKSHYFNSVASEKSNLLISNNAVVKNNEKQLLATADQQLIVQSIISLLDDGRAAMLVSADRGRGKTSALGFAVAKLMQCSNASVIVSSPIKSNVDTLFTTLNSICEPSLYNTRLQFMATDQLIEKLSMAANNNSALADLIIIDEAAAIALPVLQTITAHANRLVFSSTTYGYEGSGRGFLLRFKVQLAAQFQTFNHLTLTDPIRWSKDDDLEPFFSHLLCLKDESTLTNDIASVTDSVIKSKIDSDIVIRLASKLQLLTSEHCLQAVVALLVDAHYQTRPSDLRYLLDTPYTKLWLAESLHNGETQLLGALLICEEGGFNNHDDPLLVDIVRGQRRPQGNMMAQLLSHQSGQGDWYRLLSWRVMRIAVAMPFRRRGIAKRLLNSMQSEAKAHNCAYWSSSFGFDANLLGFWQQCSSLPVHIGLHRDKASGARNLAIVKPLSARANDMAQILTHRILHNTPLMQSNYFTELDIFSVNALFDWSSAVVTQPLSDCEVKADDMYMLRRFINAEIGFDQVYAACYRFILKGALEHEDGKQSSALTIQVPELEFTREVLRLAPNWSELAKQFALSGRRQVLDELRSCLSLLLNRL